MTMKNFKQAVELIQDTDPEEQKTVLEAFVRYFNRYASSFNEEIFRKEVFKKVKIV